MSAAVACLLFGLSVCALAGPSPVQVILRNAEIAPEYGVTANDKGQVKNCNPKVQNFTAGWEPKEIHTGGSLTIHLDIPSLSAELSSGVVSIDVYLEQDPTHPIFTYRKNVNCDDIKAYVSCPLKKGQHIVYSYTWRQLPYLPTGDYRLVAKLNDAKNEEFMCAQADVKIVD